MERDCLATEEHDVALLEQLMAGEILLPTQAASPSAWSPEKRLAGAVLRDALLEVRDTDDDPRSRVRVAEDLAWIQDDHSDWPFSFLRLCAVFGLDPAWVRQTVEAWRTRSVAPGMVSGPARVSPPVPHAA
jgi:hypothetical protein